MGARAAEKRKDQVALEVVGPFDMPTLIGSMCHEPLHNREIPILPGDFVDPDMATGVVMSVPSHAPYDWVALEEIRPRLEEYGVQKESIVPLSVIRVGGYGDHPAADIVQQMAIVSLQDTKKLDEATAELYKK